MTIMQIEAQAQWQGNNGEKKIMKGSQ